MLKQTLQHEEWQRFRKEKLRKFKTQPIMFSFFELLITMFRCYVCLTRMLQMEKFAHFYCVCPMFIWRRLYTCTSNRGHTHTHTRHCCTRTALPPPCHLLALPLPLPVYFSLSLFLSLFSPVSSVCCAVKCCGGCLAFNNTLWSGWHCPPSFLHSTMLLVLYSSDTRLFHGPQHKKIYINPQG